MSNNGRGKLVIVKGDPEPFTKSTCQCEFCLSTHLAVAEWDKHVPTTRLQLRMKEAIANIDNRLKKF